jgi:hypothetical protein
MTNEPKHWQARIWIGPKVDQPITVYGESLAQVREAATVWLRENKPSDFGNAPPEFELSSRVNYGYSDGTRQPVFPLSHFGKGRKLDEGWYCVKGKSPYSSPDHLADFDGVVSHFVSGALILEKGPDYREIPLEEGKLPLYLIKTIRRETDTLVVNDLLHRGWYIITLEYEGSQEYPEGKVVSRKTILLLGHPEERAT